MDESLNKLNEVWQGISTRLYEQSSSDGEDNVNEDMETTDVEFEEVK